MITGLQQRDSSDRNLRIMTLVKSENSPFSSDAIRVSFPYDESIIGIIHSIIAKLDEFELASTAPRAENEQYFELSEKSLDIVISRLKNYEFDIDTELLEYYNTIVDYQTNTHRYVSSIYNSSLHNMNEHAHQLAIELIGEYSNETHLKYVDRKKLLGIDYVEPYETRTLTEIIAYREDVEYQSKPSKESLEQLFLSLQELDRRKILVIFDTSPLPITCLLPVSSDTDDFQEASDDTDDQKLTTLLHEYVNSAKGISSQKQIVLFRLDGKNKSFNQAVVDLDLNNWLDRDIEVVYIEKNKLPKLLLSTGWKPDVTIIETERYNLDTKRYIYNNCDLVIDRVENRSIIKEYRSYYANM